MSMNTKWFNNKNILNLIKKDSENLLKYFKSILGPLLSVAEQGLSQSGKTIHICNISDWLKPSFRLCNFIYWSRMVRFHNPCSADTGEYLFFLLTLIQWSPLLNNSSTRANQMESLRLQGAHCIVIGPLGTSMPAEPHTNGYGHWPYKQGAGNQLCQVCINCLPGYMDLTIKKIMKMIGILSYLILGIPKPIRWHINIDTTPLFQWVFFTILF